MNRRSILSILCTGALALLAPIVAFAGSRRRDPMVLGRDGRWYRASVKHEAEMDLLTRLARGGWEYEHSEHLRFRAEAAELRTLLAEARDMLRENVMVRKSRIGTGDATYEGYLKDTLAQADLHGRIEAALKGA